jgi:hypothetical protein
MPPFVPAFLWPVPMQPDHLALIWIGMALMALRVLERFRIF